MCMCILILFLSVQMQSVDNEIILWEPIMKEQSPGEVSMSFCSLASDSLY